MEKFSNIDVVHETGIASILRSELNNYKIQYEEIKKDGIIDLDELNVIISGMNELENKAVSLKSKCVNSDESRELEELIGIIKIEAAKMTNARNNNLANVQMNQMSNQL